MSEKPDVSSINKMMRVAVLSDGSMVPVTNWFNRRGEECEPGDAVTCVAGYGSLWYSVDLEHFKLATVH